MSTADHPAPLVSVVIPCYQGEEFIAQALASVTAQTYRPLEIVVVDDGSTDGSAAVVEGFGAPDVPVRLIRSPGNRGIPSARNLGVEHAAGELIAFLDQDDFWLPQKIAEQVEALVSGGPLTEGLVCSDIYVWNDGADGAQSLRRDHRASERVNGLDRIETVGRLIESNFVSSITVLVSREAIESVGGFDAGLTGGADDWDLWLRIAERYPIVYLPEPLSIRRVHGGNYSSLRRMHGDEERILRFWEERRPELAPSIRRSRARMAYHEALHLFERGERGRAAREAWSAVRGAPLTARFWFLLLKSAARLLVRGPGTSQATCR